MKLTSDVRCALELKQSPVINLTGFLSLEMPVEFLLVNILWKMPGNGVTNCNAPRKRSTWRLALHAFRMEVASYIETG